MSRNCPEEVTFDLPHYPDGPNKKFEEASKEELLDEFLPKFEEKREFVKHLDSLFNIFDLHRNTVSLDVGGGTGLITRELASRPGARVYATEISDGFLEHLREDERIDKNKVELIKFYSILLWYISGPSSPASELPAQGTEESLCLPRPAMGTIDLAILCDVYHHITHPRAVLTDIRNALKSDGRLVLVDYWRDPEKSSKADKNWVYDHLRGDKDDFVKEIIGAGFHVIDEPEIDGVKENYVVVFNKSVQ